MMDSIAAGLSVNPEYLGNCQQYKVGQVQHLILFASITTNKFYIKNLDNEYQQRHNQYIIKGDG